MGNKLQYIQKLRNMLTNIKRLGDKEKQLEKELYLCRVELEDKWTQYNETFSQFINHIKGDGSNGN